MEISKQDQIIGVLTADKITWFLRWFKEAHLDKNPSDYITVSVDDVFEYVERHGFDETSAAYRPLEARYLIENSDGVWTTSFYERGRRQGPSYFSTKEDAERNVINTLIEGTKGRLNGQFGPRV